MLVKLCVWQPVVYTTVSLQWDYAPKMKARLGKRGGVVAVAHRIARVVYTMIAEERPYDKDIIIKNQEKWKIKRMKNQEKQLVQLKYTA